METTIEVKSLENGDVQLVVTGRLPQATMSENQKYPWGPWQVGYNAKLVENDAARILQAVANARHVEQVVGARTSAREAVKAEKSAAKQLVAAQAAGAQPSAVEVEAPASAPAAKKQTSVRSSRVKRGKGRS